MELSKILKNEAWLEGERRNSEVPLSDAEIYNRAVKIWKSENAVVKKQNLEIQDED